MIKENKEFKMLLHSRIIVLSLSISMILSSIYLICSCIKLSFDVQFFKPDYLKYLYLNSIFFIIIISSIYLFVIFCKKSRDKIILKNMKKFHDDFN